MQAAKVNDWNEFQADRQYAMWSNRYTDYICDLYDFAIKGGGNWLDLGCGFGRFLKYLLQHKPEADYIGYDSSSAMLDKLKKSFPDYAMRVFERDITEPIVHRAESVICCSVFIHLNFNSQMKILNNLANLSKYTKSIAFDIYRSLDGSNKHFDERFSKYNFRMTYQSDKVMTTLVKRLFPDFKTEVSPYTFGKGWTRVNYKLTRK